MELDDAMMRVAPPDAAFLRALAMWKNSRTLGPVETALVQVAVTALYRDRTGSVAEFWDALEKLRAALPQEAGR